MSLFILLELKAFEISKLTLSEIGMIAHKRTINLKKVISVIKIFWLKPHPDFFEFGAGLPSNVKVFSQSCREIRILDLQQVGVGTILVAKKQQ